MLRNLRERIPAGSPAAGMLVSGTRYVGWRGDEILAATGTGTHGAGIHVPWAPLAANRYRAIVGPVTGGPMALDELGSAQASASFSTTLQLLEYVDGSTAAPNVWNDVPFYGYVGPGIGATLAALDAGDDVVAMSISAAAPAPPPPPPPPPPPVAVSITVPDVGEDLVSMAAFTGDALPPLVPSLLRVVAAGRRTPMHWQALDVAEVDDVVFDFTAKLPASESLAMTMVTVEPRVGVDAGPAPLKQGAAQIQGARVLQRLRGELGVAGVTYLVRCTATLASGKTLLAAAFLPVERQR